MIVDINIPQQSRCIVKPGNKIEFGTPFLEKRTDQYLDINISKELLIKPNKIFQSLKKFVGDEVKKNELIAQKEELFGRKKFLSPVDGIIKEIDHQQGKITIIIDQKSNQVINSYFKGKVISVQKNILKLDVGKGEEFRLKKSNEDFGDETVYLEPNNLYQITTITVNKKVVVCNLVNELILAKIEALGARGYVTITNSLENNFPVALLKNSSDFKTIYTNKFPYCLVDKQSSKIYFYQ